MKFNPSDIFQAEEEIRKYLLSHDVSIQFDKEVPYGRQYSVTTGLYTGKIKIYSGKKGVKVDCSPLRDTELKNILESFVNEPDSVQKSLEKFTGVSIVGSDESGKGDYFGPLVVACVYADFSQHDVLKELGIKDSKKMNDKKIADAAKIVRQAFPHEIITINPEKYNSLYQSFGNLNRLLSWAHGRAVSNLFSKVSCRSVLIDRFSHTDWIESIICKDFPDAKVYSSVRAESNIAVAAASILARDAFCYGLHRLEKKYSVVLPKGASAETEAAARKIFAEKGAPFFTHIAKLHFKTTEKICGGNNG